MVGPSAVQLVGLSAEQLGAAMAARWVGTMADPMVGLWAGLRAGLRADPWAGAWADSTDPVKVGPTELPTVDLLVGLMAVWRVDSMVCMKADS